MSICYSVVIPLKNEEDNIEELVDELIPVMRGMERSWELICIDDGSTDGTRSQLSKLRGRCPEMRILFFDKNYGQSSAFNAGFQLARGEFVITLDGDRQNDPKDIPKMVEAAENVDLVCGRRVERKDSFFKKGISRVANAVRRKVCYDGVQDTGCSLKVYRTSCLKKIKMFNGMHRFLPALFLNEGFSVKEISVNHRERSKGQTKYTIFNRSFNTIFDMLAVRWMHKRQLRYQVHEEL